MVTGVCIHLLSYLFSFSQHGCWKVDICRPESWQRKGNSLQCLRRISVDSSIYPWSFCCCVQIISSSTPCGEFFSWSHHTLKSQQRATVAPSGSRTQPGSAAAEGGSCDLANIVKQSNELDLNIVIIWKVNAHLQDTKPNTHTGFLLPFCDPCPCRPTSSKTTNSWSSRASSMWPCRPSAKRPRPWRAERCSSGSMNISNITISPTHVGSPRKALQRSLESFVVSSLLSNVPSGLWSVISFIYFEFHSLVCRLPTNCWWQ